LVPNLSQMHPVHNFPPYFLKIHSDIIPHLQLRLPSGLCSIGFPIRILYAFLTCRTHATHIAPLTVLDLITIAIFGET
jgi:hypothetical protein